MSGDYSRVRYTPQSGYVGVFEQQGRVRLDADGNELVESLDRRRRAEAIDTIGHGVVPRTTKGAFAIASPAANTFTIGAGRAYVDGILVDCWGAAPQSYQADLGEVRGANPLDYTAQPFYYGLTFPSPEAPAIVYLDVWEREVTALEDAGLIDPALAGIDTTTRLQAAWQVKVLNNPGATTKCIDNVDWQTFLNQQRSTGVLTSGTTQPVQSDLPCVIDPTGGYTGLENRLYRVQICESGTVAQSGVAPNLTTPAKFVWSQDNATLGATIISSTPVTPAAQYTLGVSTVGKDKTLSFNVGDTLEVLDDYTEWSIRETGVGGIFVTVASVDAEQLTVTVNGDLSGFAIAGARNPRIRKWDAAPQDTNNGAVITLGTDGVTITFGPTPADTLHAGDYWVFCARTANGSLEILTGAPPRGVLHHYMKLAVLTQNNPPQDCRDFWPPESCCTEVVDVGEDIQRAIDSLPLRGGCVCLKTGIHRITQAIVISERSNITFHGETLGAVVERSTSGPVLQIQNHAANITVEHIEFAATPDAQPAPIPAPNPVPSIQNSVISVTDCSGITIHECETVLLTRDSGPLAGNVIYIQSTASFDISGNRIEGYVGGIWVLNPLKKTFPPNTMVISDNVIAGPTVSNPNGTFSAGVTGIEVSAFSGSLRIENNAISDFAQGIIALGSSVASPDLTLAPVVIQGNRIDRGPLLTTGAAFDFGWTQASGAFVGALVQQKAYGIASNPPGAFVVGNTIILADPVQGGVLVYGADASVRDNSITSIFSVPQPPAPPISAPVLTGVVGEGALEGTYAFEVTFTTATSETNPSPVSLPQFLDVGIINLSQIPVGSDPTVVGRKIYGFKFGVSTAFQLVTAIPNNTATTFSVVTDQPGWGAQPPSPSYPWAALPAGVVAYQPQAGSAERCRIAANVLTGPMKGIAVVTERNDNDTVGYPEIQDNRLSGAAYPEVLNPVQPGQVFQALDAALRTLDGEFGVLLLQADLGLVQRNVISPRTLGIGVLGQNLEGSARVDVDSNSVTGCGVGILTSGVADSLVRNGDMDSNQLAIGLYGGRGITVLRNRITGPNSPVHCFAFRSQASFEANEIQGAQTGMAAFFGTTSFVGNQVSAPLGSGIVAVACAPETLISDNRLASCGLGGGSVIEASLALASSKNSFGVGYAAIASFDCSGLVAIEDCSVRDTLQSAGGKECADIAVIGGAHVRIRGCRVTRSGIPIPFASYALLVQAAIDGVDQTLTSADLANNHIDIPGPAAGSPVVRALSVASEQAAIPFDVLFNSNMVLQRGSSPGGEDFAVFLNGTTLAVTGNRVRSNQPALWINAQSGLTYVGNVVSRDATISLAAGAKEQPLPATSNNVTA